MTGLRLKATAGRSGENGPYCAFKNDRARLWALVSRDIRLVLIAIIIAFVAPSVPAWWPLL